MFYIDNIHDIYPLVCSCISWSFFSMELLNLSGWVREIGQNDSTNSGLGSSVIFIDLHMWHIVIALYVCVAERVCHSIG